MVKLIPQLNGGSSGRIFKFELLNAINGMGIKMETDEFEKLWIKFDPESHGFVKSEIMLKRLGIDLDSLKEDSVTNLKDLFCEDSSHRSLDIPKARIIGNLTYYIILLLFLFFRYYNK